MYLLFLFDGVAVGILLFHFALCGDFVHYPVACLCGEETDGGSCSNILPMVTVSSDAVHGGYRGHGVSSHADPRTGLAELLVQHGGSAEGYCRMSGGERSVVGAVGSHLVDGMFQQIGGAGTEYE